MSSSTRRLILASAAIALLVAAVYWPITRYGFINYDDPDYVSDNRIIERGLTGDGLKWAFGRLHGERTYWHPLTWVSHMLDCQIFGVNPGAHHAINLVFHIINSMLVLLAFHQMTGAFWRSAIVAAIFALHPLQVQSVAWITERKNLLSTVFWLLATMSYVKYARSKNLACYAGSLALFALGLMSKPAVVTLPFVLLLLDFWPLDRIQPRERFRQLGKLALEKAPFFILSAASSWMTFAAHERIGMRQEIHGLSLLYRLQNAVVSYARYLKKIFLPNDLAIVYPHPGIWPAERVIAAAVLLAIITLIVVLQWKRRRYLATGWFWFLGVLVPAIGIIQVGYQAMADRFAYVATIGVLIMLAWTAAEILNAISAKRAVAATLIGATLVYLIIGTVSEVRHWKDSETLFTRALEVTSRNYVAHHNLAFALLEKGKKTEAETHAHKALAIYPKRPEPYLLLGLINEAQGNQLSAISNFTRSLEFNPNDSLARKGLAMALLKNGQAAEAKLQFLKLSDKRSDPAVHAYLGQIFTAEKNHGAALEQYRQALPLAPRWADLLNNLAWLLATSPDAQVRNGGEAVRFAEQACELTTNNVPMFIGTLAAAYAEAGRFPDAIATAQRAQKLAAEKNLPDLAQRNAELLKLYEAQTPFHEPP